MGMKDWKIWMSEDGRQEVDGEVDMSRAEFTDVVMDAFAKVDAPLKVTLKDWCENTAQRVAWGTFLGEHDGLPCDCPLASVSDVIDPNYDPFGNARNPIEVSENVLEAAGGAYIRYDQDMHDRTGCSGGVITITD